MGCPLDEGIRAEVQNPAYRVPCVVGDERVAAGEEALRSTHERHRATYVLQLLQGRGSGGDGAGVLFGSNARRFGPVRALDLLEIVEVVVGEVEREVVERQAPVGEPEVKVGFRALEGHVEATEGPLEALLDGRSLPLLLLGHLFGIDFDAGPAAVEEDDGANAVRVRESGHEGDEAAHGVAADHGVLQPEVVEDSDHVARVGLEPVTRFRFLRDSTAPQVDADEGTRRSQGPCQGAKGAVLGGDTVKADQRPGTIPGVPDRQLDLPGHPLSYPDALFHRAHYTALIMDYFENVIDAVGNTPLVRLARIERGEGIRTRLLAKIEYLNPGGSVKDRPAVKMIEVAEKEGLLKPGGTIVEPTSGNTGAGLALAAAVKGYHCICVMPDKTSKEKQDFLKALGAEVVVTPTLAPDDPESYYAVAERLADEIPGGFKPGQYENPANALAHYETTGPEVWEQTGGRITHFVAGMGTCGTITGTGRYLKEQNPEVKIVGADPEGSIFSDPNDVHQYAVEGVGEDFYPGNYDPDVVDEVIQVDDRESFLMTRHLMREEGLFVGGSCGMAVVAAVRAAKDLPESAVMVVLLPDTGRNYVSKVFDDEWVLANSEATSEDLSRPYRVFKEN